MVINWHQIKNYIKHYFTASRKGHGVHSPFAFQLCEEVFYNTHTFYAFEQLNLVRKQLLNNSHQIKMHDFGAGSKYFKNETRQVKDIALKGISSSKQSELLYKLIHYLNAKTCIELGTSIGLNTLYLASVSKNNAVYSIDACSDLTQFAKNHAQSNHIQNIEFINNTFDEALPTLLNELQNIDFVYIDGNHTYEASLRYFNWIVDKANTNTLVVLDDIYWSADMTKAWQEIKSNPKVTLSIDCFDLGLLFFKTEIKEKIELKFLI